MDKRYEEYLEKQKRRTVEYHVILTIWSEEMGGSAPYMYRTTDYFDPNDSDSAKLDQFMESHNIKKTAPILFYRLHREES